jgi:hypothetical protein
MATKQGTWYVMYWWKSKGRGVYNVLVDVVYKSSNKNEKLMNSSIEADTVRRVITVL